MKSKTGDKDSTLKHRWTMSIDCPNGHTFRYCTIGVAEPKSTKKLKLKFKARKGAMDSNGNAFKAKTSKKDFVDGSCHSIRVPAGIADASSEWQLAVKNRNSEDMIFFYDNEVVTTCA